MIDYYYRFRKSPEKKSRYDLEKYSDKYEYLHKPDRRGDIKIYFNSHCYIKAHNDRKSDYSISQNSKHLTSVYYPSLEFRNFAYGDIHNDCLLFITQDDLMVILIFRDSKPFQLELFNMLSNGELDEEIEQYR